MYTEEKGEPFPAGCRGAVEILGCAQNDNGEAVILSAAKNPRQSRGITSMMYLCFEHSHQSINAESIVLALPAIPEVCNVIIN